MVTGMNPLQRVEYELLRRTLDICDRLHIPCFLVCGSALGAVKYRGFIPWDDDVDVAMLRPDYQRFVEEAPAYLPPELFLQTYRTDPAFPHIYAKLRDSRTTFIETSSAGLAINHGIYIDIFPLDGYPSGTLAGRVLEAGKWLYGRALACAFAPPVSRAGRMVWRAMRLCGCHRRTQRIAARYERMISRYTPDGSAWLCNHGNWQGRLDYARREQFGDGAPAVFEGLAVRIPAMYDQYLTQKYGDWRADPPQDRRASHHGCAVCDTEKPYTYYRNR